jgi:hypothetical protein
MTASLETAILDALPQVFRAAQEGDSHRTIVAMRRFIAHLREASPGTAEKLNATLFGGASATRRADILRRAEPVAAPPLERETNVPLLRPVVAKPEVEPKLPAEQEKALSEFLLEQAASDKLLRSGLTPRSTVLLIGPPGVGKTLLATAIAARLGLPLVQVELASAMSSFLGRTGQNVKEVLDYARSNKVVLLLDEFDAIAKRRDDQSDLGELKRIVSVLLKELEDWPGPSVIVAATNHEELIDQAVFRRFDLILRLPLPEASVAAEILRAHLVPERVSEKLALFAGQLLAGGSGSKIRALAHEVRRARCIGDGETTADALLLQRLVAVCGSVEARKRFCTLAVSMLPEKERTISRIAALFGVAKSTAHSYMPHGGGQNERPS